MVFLQRLSSNIAQSSTEVMAVWLCGGVLVVFLWWCFCVGCVVVFFVMVFFPKAAAKGSFKKRAVFKDCHQTSPKVLLK